jgi:nicotinamidase-related amidase
MDGPHGEQIAVKNQEFMQELHTYDVVVIAGQAKSHCVAWTIDDLLGYILEIDESLVKKVYLLEDCSSPVVIPGVIDYTDQADAAYQRFAQAGMHIVRSTEPLHNWLDI